MLMRIIAKVIIERPLTRLGMFFLKMTLKISS